LKTTGEKRINVTARAYDQLGQLRSGCGRITRKGIELSDGRFLEAKGAELNDGRILKITSIRVRVLDPQGPGQIIYLLQSELDSIAGHFGLPAELIEGAYFRSVTVRKQHGGKHVLPIPFELLDPQWRSDYYRWLAGSASVPSPASFAWLSYRNGVMPVPGQDWVIGWKRGRIGAIEEGECGEAGRIFLRQEGERKVGYFVAGETARKWQYLNDGVSFLSLFPVPPDCAEPWMISNDENRPYSVAALAGLLGKKPKELTYSCVITTWPTRNQKISLGPQKGLGLVLEFSPGMPVFPNQEYFLTFKRINNDRRPDRLELECFSDPERLDMIGKASMELFNGTLSSGSLILKPPSPARSDRGAAR
jgi:hypothetical protein